MLVDDDLDKSTIFKIALEDNEFEFEVDTFNDPTMALSAFKPYFCDLVIVDIKMPKMNGYELYDIIRKKDNKLKVCFLTASVDAYKWTKH